MAELNLPYPKKIDESLPANLKCGVYDLPERFKWYEDEKEMVLKDGQMVDNVKQAEPSSHMGMKQM